MSVTNGIPFFFATEHYECPFCGRAFPSPNHEGWDNVLAHVQSRECRDEHLVGKQVAKEMALF